MTTSPPRTKPPSLRSRAEADLPPPRIDHQLAGYTLKTTLACRNCNLSIRALYASGDHRLLGTVCLAGHHTSLHPGVIAFESTQPCPTCRTPLTSVTTSNYAVTFITFCPTCSLVFQGIPESTPSHA